MLDELLNAIVARLNTDIPGLAVCEAYPKLEKSIALPALLTEIDDIDPGDFGNETFDCWVRLKTFCIYDRIEANSSLEVIKLATAVAVAITQEDDFGLSVEKGADIFAVGPDDFKAELDGYHVWSVEYRIGITLGETEWLADPADGVPVSQITVGDLSSIDINHVLADGNEPSSGDSINLPEQPKG